jgi:mRNA interferase MazF
MISDQWDLVRVPFPFTDRAAVKKRPAAVLSTRAFNAASGHTIMAMVTKRDNSDWPADYEIKEWMRAGLKFPSWLRAKLFTLENSLIVDRLGKLQPVDARGGLAALRTALW